MTAPDFSVAEILAWARTKPAGEKYDYCDSGNCPVAQFLMETGRARCPVVGPWDWLKSKRGKSFALPLEINNAALREKRTFGTFADRLEALSA